MIGKGEKVIWAAGEHTFRFAIGELRALEKSCDSGVAVVLTRLMGSQFRVDDIVEVLRIGLMGGGMNERAAMQTIEKAYPHANLYDLSVTAARVLATFVTWPTDNKEADNPLGESQAPTMTTANQDSSPSPTGSGDGQPSSVPLQ